MKYLQKTFTCPASENTSQSEWDRIFLSPEEFQAKYGGGVANGPQASNTTANLPQSTVKY